MLTVVRLSSGYVSKIKKFTLNGLVLKPTNDDDLNYAGLYGDDDILHTTFDSIVANSTGEGDVLVNKAGTVVTASSKGLKEVKDSDDNYYVVDYAGDVLLKYSSKDALNAAKAKDEDGNFKNADYKKAYDYATSLTTRWYED